MRQARIVLALCAGIACGPESSAPPALRPDAPAPAEGARREPAEAPTREAAPARGVARGEVLYGRFCAACHGPRGEGDGPVAAGLNPKPARHSDGAYMNALPDAHLFRVIRDGGPAVGKSPLMAPWGGTLDDAEIRDVILFIRGLADPPYEAEPSGR